MSAKKCPHDPTFPTGSFGLYVDHKAQCIGPDCALWDPETNRCGELLRAQSGNRRVCPDCGGAGDCPVLGDEGEVASVEPCERCGGSGMLLIITKEAPHDR